jgi:predicted nucleic acid-binding protein
MNELFLDTSFSIGLVSPRDQIHKKAFAWSEKIENSGISVVTTRAILLEIGNALSKTAFRQVGIGLLDNLENDSNTAIISLTDKIYNEAFELFRSRPDKEWGLGDCVSFVVMRERKITAALTADEHFIQAGFRALLTEQ